MAALLTTRGKFLELNLRQGFMLTSGSWIVLALFGHKLNEPRYRF